MNSLILLRHAEAISGKNSQSDFDRELTTQGLLDANNIGQRLFAAEIRPGLIIASPAKRTQQTAIIVAAALQYDVRDIIFDDRLYDNTQKQTLKIIHEVDESIHQLLLIAHNPTLSDLIHTICGPSTLHLSTSCAAEIILATANWYEVDENTGYCQQYCSPN